MPEFGIKNRVFPCLLDRLKAEPGAGTGKSASASLSEYRESVQRDLSWLMNSACKPPDSPIYDYGEAETSVVNYGVRSAVGALASHARELEIERWVADAIRRFEPRLDQVTVDLVLVDDDSERNRHRVALEIRGRLWARPAPESLYIRTELDLESGSCTLERQ